MTVERRDGSMARGWIVSPGGASGPVPGVVLVPGAGPADRDTLLDTATVLASLGVAAAVYDKRTEGYSFRTRDYRRLADDAVDAAAMLARHPDVDPARVGVLGLSEGGWVAPLAVAASPQTFAFMVLVSATIVSPLEQAVWAVDVRMAEAPEWMRRVPAVALAGGRGFLDYLDTDISRELTSVDVPIYAVWGADDRTAPVAAAVRALTATATAAVTAVILPGTGHDPGTGAWLDDLARWITGLPDTAAARGTTVSGVEPNSRHGVPQPPENVWYLNPFAHLAAAVLLSVASMFLPPIRLNRKREPQ